MQQECDAVLFDTGIGKPPAACAPQSADPREPTCGNALSKFRRRKRTHTEMSAMQQIVQTNPAIVAVAAFSDSDDDAVANDGAPPPTTTNATTAKLTQMEEQVAALKHKYADMLLLFECGYRMRMFGRDAENASRVLGIRAQRHRHFMEASVPVHRTLFHARRLVARGYKVGVVQQLTSSSSSTATASGQPLARDVVEIYTRATIPYDDHHDHDDDQQDDDKSAMEMPMEMRDDNHKQRSYGKQQRRPWESRFILAIVEETIQSTRLFSQRVHEIEPRDRVEMQLDHVRIGLFGYDIHTGESIADEFEDDSKRQQLREWLSRIKPVEFVLPFCELSMLTEQVVGGGGGSSYASLHQNTNLRPPQEDDEEQTDINDDRENGHCFSQALPAVYRVERVQVPIESPDTKPTTTSPTTTTTSSVLPELARISVSLMFAYLKSLRLDTDILSLHHSPGLQSAAATHRMRLPSATQHDLHLFCGSSTTQQTDGSLFSVINHTQTPFGARRLRDWMLYPLTDVAAIKQRQDAVAALAGVTGHPAVCYETLREDILPKAIRVERVLQQLHLRRATVTPRSLLDLLKALESMERHIAALDDFDLADEEEKHLVGRLQRGYPRNLPSLHAAIKEINDDCTANDLEAAVAGQWTKYPLEKMEYDRLRDQLRDIGQALGDYLETCRLVLQSPSLEYSSYRSGGSGLSKSPSDNLVISVLKNELQYVPDDWLIVNSTKTMVRFVPRTVRDLQLQRDMLEERKTQLIRVLWCDLLGEIDRLVYMKAVCSVDTLAQLDVLCSFATVVRLYPNYVRPDVLTSGSKELTIVAGRHPMVERLATHGASYIASDVSLLLANNDDAGGTALLVTGPNMGGKSTLLRMVGLLVVLAQMGSFVPAQRMTLSICDAIYTRMHRFQQPSASDGELKELSVITSQTTRGSLVLLDEVGFGLTTAHAQALAVGTVKYLATKIGCFVIMATHRADAIDKLQRDGKNGNKSHFQAKVLAHQLTQAALGRGDKAQESAGSASVVYLYTPRNGVARQSFALQAAALARLPPSILTAAAAGHQKQYYS